MAGGAAHDPGQPALALASGDPDALRLRAVFRLTLRQTEGLVGSVIGLPGFILAVPDHSTLSRRAETLGLPRPHRDGGPCTCWWTAAA